MTGWRRFIRYQIVDTERIDTFAKIRFVRAVLEGRKPTPQPLDAKDTALAEMRRLLRVTPDRQGRG